MGVGGTLDASELFRGPTSAWPLLQMPFGEVESLPWPTLLAGWLWVMFFLKK